MRQIVTITHTLEIAGPRGQIWRPATDKHFAGAIQMSQQDNPVGALEAAQEAYVAAHGNMHGVSFRIRTVKEVLSGLGSAESILIVPT